MSKVSTKSIYLHAGVYSYRLQITRHLMVNSQGKRVLAAAVQAVDTKEAGVIYISADLPRDRRYAKAAHELSHTHEWHLGVPSTEEDRALRIEAVIQQLDRDLDRQGGRDALLVLEVEDDEDGAGE